MQKLWLILGLPVIAAAGNLAAEDGLSDLLDLGDRLVHFFCPPKHNPPSAPVLAEPGQTSSPSPEVLLGGQVYSTWHHSTPEEWEERKQLYQELITLRSGNRQPGTMTLNMKRYQEIAGMHFEAVFVKYQGKVRSIPICEELIPAEYQSPEVLKKTFYNQFAWEHSNYCDYLKTLPPYDLAICTYFSLSTELEELQKPILDLLPSTMYSMTNLRGRMKYLRLLYPELRKLQLQIIELENPSSSKVNQRERLERYNSLTELKKQYPIPPFIKERLTDYRRILKIEWDKAYEQYHGQISIIPTAHEEFLPERCLYSEEEKQKYLAEYHGWNQNFCDYLNTLPRRKFLICSYMRYVVMVGLLQEPIVNLKTDEPYPLENLSKRLQMINYLLKEMKQIEPEIINLEKSISITNKE